MYVVVNISPGADMSYVMATLAERALTFSVTDDLSKICVRCNGKSSQPLPVPHQLESPPVANHKTEPHPVGRDPAHPMIREPQQAGPSGLPILKFRMPSGAVHQVHQMPKMVTKKIEIRKRGTEEEINLTSEPDPLVLDEDHPMAQNALNQLAGVLVQQPPPMAARVVNPTEPPVKKIKEEEGVPENKMRFGMDTLSPANAAAIVSDLFREAPSTSHGFHDDISPYSRAAKEFRGECRLCQLPISTRTHHMRRHAMKHLGYKTYLCQLCEKEFNRSDLCKSHFERYHPAEQLVPFKDIITPEQQIKLDQMLTICFPEEHKNRA